MSSNTVSIRKSSRIVGVMTSRIMDLGYRLSRHLSGHAGGGQMRLNRLRTLFPSPEPKIVDIGANIGGFAETAFQACPDAHILSVEPIPEHVQACMAKFGTKKGYEVVQAAMGSESKSSVTFHVLPSAPQSSSMMPPSAAAKASFRSLATPTRPITVPMYSLDDLLLTRPAFQTIDLLKLNIEGYEPLVLEGSKQTLPRCKAVLTEVHFRPMNEGCDTFDKVCHQLRSAGFRYDMPFGEIRDHFGELLLMHMLFVRSSSADA